MEQCQHPGCGQLLRPGLRIQHEQKPHSQPSLDTTEPSGLVCLGQHTDGTPCQLPWGHTPLCQPASPTSPKSPGSLRRQRAAFLKGVAEQNTGTRQALGQRLFSFVSREHAKEILGLLLLPPWRDTIPTAAHEHIQAAVKSCQASSREESGVAAEQQDEATSNDTQEQHSQFDSNIPPEKSENSTAVEEAPAAAATAVAAVDAIVVADAGNDAIAPNAEEDHAPLEAAGVSEAVGAAEVLPLGDTPTAPDGHAEPAAAQTAAPPVDAVVVDTAVQAATEKLKQKLKALRAQFIPR